MIIWSSLVLYLGHSLVQLLSHLLHIPLSRFSWPQTCQNYGHSLQVIHLTYICFLSGNIFMNFILWSSLPAINSYWCSPVFFFNWSALLSWIAFPARLFQVQELYFTQVWKGCWKLLSSDNCYTVSLLVLHFKTTTKHICSNFRLEHLLNYCFFTKFTWDLPENIHAPLSPWKVFCFETPTPSRSQV